MPPKAASFLFLKIFLMLPEEIVEQSDIWELRPAGGGDGAGIHIVDPRAADGQKDGGMGGDDQLASVEAGRLQKEGGQLHLEHGGQAVLRLVQKIEGILADGVREKF